VVISHFPFSADSAENSFNIQPQFYGFKPVDEVIRQRRAGEARTGYATGFNPWLLTLSWPSICWASDLICFLFFLLPIINPNHLFFNPKLAGCGIMNEILPEYENMVM
jgi:hypothetical protein